jgi:hypothetical protein
VVYSRNVRVRRLEVSSLWVYFGKQMIYGRDFNRYGKIAAVRPLNASERMEIFRRTVRNRGYSLPRAAYLFAVLSVGALCYEFVRRFGRPRDA